MTATTTDKAPRAASRVKAGFYMWVAVAMAATAFIGFAPTFWLPLAAHSFKANPIIYVHGTVFFAWTLFFCFQTWLASSGRVMNHRSVGLIGVSFATAMTIFGTLAAINAMKMAALGGMKHDGIAFAIVPLSGIAFFAHAVGETNTELKALIGGAAVFGGPGFLVPTRNADLLRWCLQRGLRITQPMTLMSIGLYNEPQGAFLPSIAY